MLAVEEEKKNPKKHPKKTPTIWAVIVPDVIHNKKNLIFDIVNFVYFTAATF